METVAAEVGSGPSLSEGVVLDYGAMLSEWNEHTQDYLEKERAKSARVGE